MRDGTIAETDTDRLQNKLRGVGSFMLRANFPEQVRMRMAHGIRNTLNDPMFTEIDARTVFAAFFGKGELSERGSHVRVRATRAEDT